MELYPHQIENAKLIYKKLTKYKICYLSAEVRSGKTLSALEGIKLYGSKNILFLTKKKAISSIQNDYNNFGYKFGITVINYESLHKVEGQFDLIVLDESHVNGAFPKPSLRTKMIKQRYSHLPMIMLSGTPAVESGSQWFHQFWISKYSPFKNYTTFYKWATDFVNIVKIDYGNGYPSNDYSKANREKIEKYIEDYRIILSQKEAGFTTIIDEKVLYYDCKPITKTIADKLLKDRVVIGNNDVILADTPVKLMTKLHQIWNGTCIGESGNTILIDDSKAKFIHDKFKNNKIAIFYYFKAELDIIQQVYGDSVTTDLTEFNNSNKNIALQQSALEGMNLSKADYIVYYNFGFSGKAYIQSKDRLTTRERKSNEIFFVFERGGISEKIYKAVRNKQSYNIKLFNRDYGKANG